MEQVFEGLVIGVITLIFLWFHVTHFLTKKAGSVAGLVIVVGLIGSAYYEFYQENYPVYVYAIVPLVFLLIDAVIVGLRRLY